LKGCVMREGVHILLPLYPRAEARGTLVFVLDEDGSELFWGREGSREEAEAVAGELQLELRAISYVEKELGVFLSEMSDGLTDLGVPLEHVADVIHEGYCNFMRMLKKVGRRDADRGDNPHL